MQDGLAVADDHHRGSVVAGTQSMSFTEGNTIQVERAASGDGGSMNRDSVAMHSYCRKVCRYGVMYKVRQGVQKIGGDEHTGRSVIHNVVGGWIRVKCVGGGKGKTGLTKPGRCYIVSRNTSTVTMSNIVTRMVGDVGDIGTYFQVVGVSGTST